MTSPMAQLMPLFDFAALGGTALVFLFPVTHRRRITTRYILIGLIYLLTGSLSSYFPFNYPSNWILEYLITFIAVSFCAEMTRREVIYHTIWIVIATKLYMTIYSLIDLLLFAENPSWPLWLQLIFIILYIGLYIFLIGISIARALLLNHTFHIGPRQFLSSLLLMILFEVLGYFLEFLFLPERNFPMSFLIVMSQVYAVTVLFLQNALFSQSAIRQELDKLNYLWQHQKNQYKLSKENISLINRKCHDLRHQVAAIRQLGTKDDRDSVLKEVEDSIRIYDSLVRTNNEALDTILTEKSLYCQSHAIHINCVADGEKMNFIAPVDIYTIFGNAMDNAIESVIRNKNRENRFIDVMVFLKNEMLIISIINPLDRRLEFDEDLPRSTKPANGYHGFGLKSIRHTVEKYNGFVTVDTRNDSFTLSLVIPLARSRENR